jgi:hypothetical protein
MLQHLVPRGHTPGGGLLSPAGVFYLNIPKNASTYLTNLLVFNGWKHHNLNTDGGGAINECIVVLRDPVERWVSGFATYAASWILSEGYGSDHFRDDYNELSQRLIFDVLVFDDHTTEQVQYVSQLPKIKTTYFKLNHGLKSDLQQHLGYKLLDSKDLDANVSENNYDTKMISKHMQYRIDQDPVLKAKIIEKYKADYDFIKSANFYYYDPR